MRCGTSRRWCVLGVMLAVGVGGFARADITVVNPTAPNYWEYKTLTMLPPGCGGYVKLVPAKAARLAPPAGGSNFATAFGADAPTQFPDWLFAQGASLGGTVNITRYTARDYGTEPGSLAAPAGGARLRANYAPAMGENVANLRWIQMYTDNAGPMGATRRHIDPFPNDDGAGADAGASKKPWYYTNAEMTALSGGLSLSNFSDDPGDTVPGCPFFRTVQFELYLASFSFNAMTSKWTATVHDGFSWGYEIHVAPEPSSLLIWTGMVGLVVGARRWRQRPMVG